MIDCAERLWGERGLDAVSLRQISASVGLANPNSVQYHFANREGLVRAIFAHRLPALDARRGEMLDAAEQRGCAADLRALLDCLFRPLVEFADPQGRPTYPLFLRQVLQSTWARDIRVMSSDVAPHTRRLSTAIVAAAPQVPPVLATERIISANIFLLDRLYSWRREPGAFASLTDADLYEDTLDFLAAGCAQAPSPAVRRAAEALGEVR
jgi:AcrR family transcriptional regulator